MNKGTSKPHSISSAPQGGRTRPTGGADEMNAKPDPEVVARITRRRLTNSYKLKVVNMVDSLRADGNGAIGAYLRKEGIYYSMVHKWSHLRDQGAFTTGRTTNGVQRDRAAILAENKQLRRKLEQTERRLHKSELLVELQKKISAILELDNQGDCARSAA